MVRYIFAAPGNLASAISKCLMHFDFADFNSYACLALSCQGIRYTGNPIWASKNFLVHSEIPVAVDNFWLEELGKIKARELAEANVVLIAFSDDHNYEDLKHTTHSFHYGLLLQGVGFSQNGTILAGPVLNGNLHVSSIGDIRSFYESPKVNSPAIEPSHVRQAVRLASGLNHVYFDEYLRTQGERFGRLRKGFRSLIDGLKSDEIHVRLHLMVRAIEAAVMPRRNRLKSDFKDRARFFTSGTSSESEILDELYELRSAAEHMNPLVSKLHKYNADEKKNTLATRCYQSELLAQFIYRTILSDSRFYPHYESESAIEKFWESNGDRLLMTETLNIEVAANANNHSFLPTHW